MATAMLEQLFRPPALADFTGPFAAAAEGLRAEWDRTSRDAAENRRLDELHAARDEYRALLEGHLRLVEDYLALTELHQRAFGPNPACAGELNRVLGTLRGLHDELFPRWRTAQDLHQILVEKFSLPAAKLRDLAAKSPPPPAWFEETADPFSACLICDGTQGRP